MKDAIQIISLWPSRQALADDLGGSLSMVHSWVKRNRIAAGYHFAIAQAAKKRGLSVSLEDLARSRSRSKGRHFAHKAQEGDAA